jgi:hypothetical protein
MARFSKPRRNLPVRVAVAMLALIAHLSTTFAIPLPASNASADDDGQPYPCRGHSCGCLSAEECWQGDCCCYTLEQKLAWADERGIEPPPHVRPLVASRQASARQVARTASCCSEHAATITGSCCQHHEASTRTRTAATSAPERHASDSDRPTGSIRWVVGVFADKCHGAGPAGLHHPDLITSPAMVSAPVGDRHAAGMIIDRASAVLFTTFCPPIPPPRAA